MKKNYYDILEISPQATDEQIKAAVVQLGRKYAAKAQNNSVARTKFNDIQQAYKVLSHPQRRKYHDETLAEQSGHHIAEVGHSLRLNAGTKQLEIKRFFYDAFYAVQNKFQETVKAYKVLLHRQHDNTHSVQQHQYDDTNVVEQSMDTSKITHQPEPVAKQDKLRGLTKLSLNPKQIEAKKRHYGLFSDETILFYSKPHFLSCLDIVALALIVFSSYLYITDPLRDYMPVVTLWLPSQLSTILPEISLWHLGTGVMLLMGIVIQLEVLINKFSTELLLTQNRIIVKTGALGNNKTEIKLNAMESVSIHQSLLGRLFNYGAVNMTGSGQGKVVLRNITAPHKMSRLIWFYIKAKTEV
ncbi:DnaJ domain-containing protein [Candidatus Albibeggiatoa sp. nov. NOAA]|uniref:DnaJ domain-containing protein n=1 Tax=Candidatus Albibeggiatoa sp. nov. NOAA TaxID=3162724 RepID=UPI0032F8AB1D|nr:DnaJ domain-containing protein [Thiotrichaceae bacterium]